MFDDSLCAKWINDNWRSELKRARGFFDCIQLVEGCLRVTGWMLLPDTEFDCMRIYVNGELHGESPRLDRPDLGAAFPSIPHAARCAFIFVIDDSPRGRLTGGRIEVLGYKSGQPVAMMDSLFRTDIDSAVPTPPPELMIRVAHIQNPHFFKITGLKCFGDYALAIAKRRDLRKTGQMLDWGCGCGRVTAHFLAIPDGPCVFGCDIDREAILWCSQHLSNGTFAALEPWPPAPFDDKSFHLIVSYSVFTHLHREAQDAWLREMRRLLVPGGLFLTSIHGEFAASFAFPGRAGEALANGICDNLPDTTLNGVAPDGYYRSVYQTRDYTTRAWSKYFEILEYRELGAANFQDLIVMRRAA